MLSSREIDGSGLLSFLYVMTRQALFLALLLLSSAYAFIKGGQPERIGAATLLCGASLTVFSRRLSESGFRGSKPAF